MKRVFGAAVLLLAAWPAAAADLPRSAAMPAWAAPVLGYNWSGGYLGANVGYLWGDLGSLPNRPQGITGGLQAGYNWQIGQVVFGAETDLQASAAEDMFAPYKFSNPWFGSVRGRAGFAFNNALLYATAGFAYGGGKLEIAGLTESKMHAGWTGGGGIEIGLTPHWSAKAEYLFTSLGDKTYVLSGVSGGIDSHIVRSGLNYRF